MSHPESILQKIDNLPNEVWKSIEGYESRYEVSNKGRIKSYVSTHNGRKKYKSEKILKQSSDNWGYRRVVLTNDDGVKKQFLVHRLVIVAFKCQSNDLFVNHIDGIKSNNYSDNLEWVTRSENQKHAYRIGLEKPCDNGLKKKIALVKNSQIIDMQISIRELCRKHKLDRRSVQRVLKGERSHCKGYVFELI